MQRGEKRREEEHQRFNHDSFMVDAVLSVRSDEARAKNRYVWHRRKIREIRGFGEISGQIIIFPPEDRREYGEVL